MQRKSSQVLIKTNKFQHEINFESKFIFMKYCFALQKPVLVLHCNFVSIKTIHQFPVSISSENTFAMSAFRTASAFSFFSLITKAFLSFFSSGVSLRPFIFLVWIAPIFCAGMWTLPSLEPNGSVFMFFTFLGLSTFWKIKIVRYWIELLKIKKPF